MADPSHQAKNRGRVSRSAAFRGARSAPCWPWVLILVSVLTARLAAAEIRSFRTTILPLLTKAGCNAGACHGAATGQAGFKLSLLGYDPEEDYVRITRELGGRRLDSGAPESSLILLKPTRQLSHEGGRRIARDSEAYQVLVRWIAEGAPYGSKELHVTRLSVTPAESLLLITNQTVQLRVQAGLSDGSTQDVTSTALYSSNDDAIATVSKTGEVTTLGAGLTSIMVRHPASFRIISSTPKLGRNSAALVSRLHLRATTPNSCAAFTSISLVACRRRMKLETF
jgi:hypothetical protein